MDVNFKLVLPDNSEIDANVINWVTWNQDGGGLKEAHDGPEVGRSLVLDMQTMSMDMLLALSQSNFEGFDKLRSKSVYKYLSKPLLSVEESTHSNVKFTTEDGQFELLINSNPAWVKPRSPFSLG